MQVNEVLHDFVPLVKTAPAVYVTILIVTAVLLFGFMFAIMLSMYNKRNR